MGEGGGWVMPPTWTLKFYTCYDDQTLITHRSWQKMRTGEIIVYHTISVYFG